MAFPAMIIPKTMEICTIELYIDMDWDDNKVKQKSSYWFNSLKSFAAVILGKTGIDIPLNHIGIERGSYDRYQNFGDGQVVLVITTMVKAYDDDRFKDAIKEYMKLIIPALDCTDAAFYITKESVYSYNNCK